MDQHENEDQQTSRLGKIIPTSGLTQKSNLCPLIIHDTLVRIITFYICYVVLQYSIFIVFFLCLQLRDMKCVVLQFEGA